MIEISKEIKQEWNKTEIEDMNELINKLKYFRRRWKSSLFSNQEKQMRDLEKELIRIKKTYLS